MTMSPEPTRAVRGIETDRAIMIAALSLVAAAAWGYTIWMAHAMRGMALASVPWSAGHFVAVFVMWSIMMAAMMLPSAMPMILLYGELVRRRRAVRVAYAPTTLFATGYLIAWTVASLILTVLHWPLERAGLLDAMMDNTSPALAAVLLIAAGVFQLSPLKHACLRHCRTPMQFILAHWRDGSMGAVAMGFRHGLWCAGCCWALMLLLFAVGVMNLLWVGALTAYVAVEKIVPKGELIGRYAGFALLAAGIAALILALR